MSQRLSSKLHAFAFGVSFFNLLYGIVLRSLLKILSFELFRNYIVDDSKEHDPSSESALIENFNSFCISCMPVCVCVSACETWTRVISCSVLL